LGQINAINVLNINNSYSFGLNLIKNQHLDNYQLMRSITTSTQINLFKLNENFSIQKRFKKGKKGSKQQKKEESSDEESDEELSQSAEDDPDLIDGKAIGFSDLNTTVTSLRLDNIAKAGLNIPRAKVDEVFYANLLRVNGERVAKKSTELVENDVVDYIKGLNAENTDLIDVTRVILKSIEDKMSTSGRIKVKLRKFLKLTIPNYQNEPYDGLTINRSKSDKSEE